MLATEAFVIDRTRNTVTLTRRIKAAPARLFAAWTRPDEIAQWWDPAGVPLQECQIDLCVGGKLRLVNRNAAHAFEGTYRVIEPPSLLVFDAMGATGRLSLVPEGEATTMTLVMTCSSAAHLDQFLAMGIADGTARTLDNLAVFAAGA